MLYGSEDAGLKLSGVADMRFGVTPQVQAVLTARQLDADRLIAQRGGGTPAELAKALAVSIAALPRVPFAAQLNVGAETVTLGGRPIQGIGLDLRGDANGWTLDRLELRAPGTSRVAASGRLQFAGNIPSFKGTASIDANDPDLLMAWLQGKTEFQRSARTLKARGDITIAPTAWAPTRSMSRWMAARSMAASPTCNRERAVAARRRSDRRQVRSRYAGAARAGRRDARADGRTRRASGSISAAPRCLARKRGASARGSPMTIRHGRWSGSALQISAASRWKAPARSTAPRRADAWR